MQADEVVGVALGLLAGGEGLTRVLDETRGLRLFGGEGVGGLEADLLLRQLVFDVALREVRVAGHDEPEHEQEDGKCEPAHAEEHIEGSAFHFFSFSVTNG